MATFTVSAADYAALFARQEAARARRVTREAPLAAALESAPYVASRAPRDLGRLGDSVRVVPDHAAQGPLVADLEASAPHAGAVENGTRPHVPPLDPLIAWVRRNYGLLVGASRARPRRVRRPVRRARQAGSAGVLRRAVLAALRSIGLGPAHARRALRRVAGLPKRSRAGAGLWPTGAPPRPHGGGSEAQIRGIAIGIQKKIALHGSPPTHFMRSTLTRQRAVLGAHIRRAIQDP